MDNSEDKMPGGVAKKIDVSFDEAEKKFNEDGKTLEDIIDEELASEPKPVEEESVEKEPMVEEAAEEPVEIPRASVGNDPEPRLVEEREEIEEVREPVIEERPIRASKKKSGKGLIVFLVILVILLVAGFAVYYCLSTGVIKNDLFAKNEVKCETEKADPVETAKVSDDEEVKAVIEGLKNSISATHQIGTIRMTYDSDFPQHKINEDGTLTSLNKSYALVISNYGEDWLTINGQFNATAVEYLKNAGFEDYVMGGFGAQYYKNSESDIICGGFTDMSGTNEWAVSCAKENWASEEDDKLAKDLASAYKTATGNSADYIYASVEDIKSSTFSDEYENISVSLGGGHGVFYRKITADGTGEWIFALGRQDVGPCSEISDEAKEALAGSGEPCITELNADGTYSEENVINL